jgi:8-oxo-dGTP pyrophosphatase MutT (NUDIX family)
VISIWATVVEMGRWVGGVLRDPRGRFVLQLRSGGPNVSNAGLIGVFGGMALEGESDERALIRELKEELNLCLLPADIGRLIFEGSKIEKSGATTVGAFYEVIRVVELVEVTLLEGSGIVLISPGDLQNALHMARLSCAALVAAGRNFV